ncbi:uncharacterized protein C8Q71DRAFT_200026 [Rhodofomes roseus]|uniref:Secreted protein n=1 Tax=Rhodofomes roseus TaxID=34475 RepID=A0ABQ8KTE8_9APHY|nr:uncharacterized protein C8Q71DRAFT_200026 [Rhodofomes roseus]KAH9842358.1 hypothetical protein C8Q71DRAFT_200026 [Rhodofomes roseus]
MCLMGALFENAILCLFTTKCLVSCCHNVLLFPGFLTSCSLRCMQTVECLVSKFYTYASPQCYVPLLAHIAGHDGPLIKVNDCSTPCSRCA